MWRAQYVKGNCILKQELTDSKELKLIEKENGIS